MFSNIISKSHDRFNAICSKLFPHARRPIDDESKLQGRPRAATVSTVSHIQVPATEYRGRSVSVDSSPRGSYSMRKKTARWAALRHDMFLRPHDDMTDVADDAFAYVYMDDELDEEEQQHSMLFGVADEAFAYVYMDGEQKRITLFDVERYVSAEDRKFLANINHLTMCECPETAVVCYGPTFEPDIGHIDYRAEGNDMVAAITIMLIEGDMSGLAKLVRSDASSPDLMCKTAMLLREFVHRDDYERVHPRITGLLKWSR